MMMRWSLMAPLSAGRDSLFSRLRLGAGLLCLVLVLMLAFASLASAGFGQAGKLQRVFDSGEVSEIQKQQEQPATDVAPPVLKPQKFDYELNVKSDVFGAQLFTGAFARQGPTRFNPAYAVAIGDQIQVRFWGGFDYDAVLTVDPKGNVFLPHVGPVNLLGVRNQDLQQVVDAAAKKVFKANVYSYANLAAAQPVRVFVGGFVRRPGLYHGTSMDSLLHYLDQAGGIDPETGSFLDVQVKRSEVVRKEINLYDFLLNGQLAPVQFADGDVIFVQPRKNTVKVSDLVSNPKRFEFDRPNWPVSELIKVAKPSAEVTHVRITRNSGPITNVEYFPLEDAAQILLNNGDEIEFSADKQPGTITVRIAGEHEGAHEYVLPYGTNLGTFLDQVVFTPRSDTDNLQLFRRSVKVRQKEMLLTSLQSLEAAALTARSGTNEEASLRKEEAELLLQWVERAKAVEPIGQVQMPKTAAREKIILENGDIVRIPTRDGLVLVSGEVLFPTAIAYQPDLNLKDYVHRAGGYTQNANSSRIVLAHRDGRFVQVAGEAKPPERDEDGFPVATAPEDVVAPGDEILVLPKIDVKSRQIAKDLTQIMFQIAVVAGVLLSI